jgi:endo-1,4-beta-D-glucanase Y
MKSKFGNIQNVALSLIIWFLLTCPAWAIGNDKIPGASAAAVSQTGQYRNLFKEIGKSDSEIDTKINTAVNNFFFGNETLRCYYTMGTDEAYILDSGNNDVRSEGMSYGMMIAVQMGMKTEFDRLWNYAYLRMRHASGGSLGYFAWQMNTDGTVRGSVSAPDGEEYFAMTLYFAWKRWSDPAYKAAADDILHHMFHQDQYASPASGISRMIDPNVHQVVFVPYFNSATFTDPSYHLPAFYELYARWAKEDNSYWSQVATTSRAFFKTAAHPVTGLYPDYANFDGTPNAGGSNHDSFRFDAWRVIQNIAVDYYWFKGDPWEVEEANRLQNFFAGQGITTHGNQYTLSGTQLSSSHSVGLVAMNAVASLIATNTRTMDFVRHFWDSQPTSGQYRYYDGCLYLLGLLHCSGKYQIIGLDIPRSQHQNQRDPNRLRDQN